MCGFEVSASCVGAGDPFARGMFEIPDMIDAAVADSGSPPDTELEFGEAVTAEAIVESGFGFQQELGTCRVASKL